MPYTATAKRVFLPKRGHFAHFTPLSKMRQGHPTTKAVLHPSFAAEAVPLPINWYKTLSFPMDGNDNYGDCFYAAGCHADNTFTGNVGQESVFDVNTIIRDYLALSGGDNGLDEGQITGEWKNGLAGVPAAKIYDVLDVDVNNAALVQTMIANFGNILFTFAVPDAWFNGFDTGVTWDAPATADQNNGHAVLWNGVDTNGNYRLQTWGSWCWITPRGVRECDPAGFAVFSPRWFNAQGYAPNGKSYAQLAALWQQLGGAAVPPFVPPTPPPGPTSVNYVHINKHTAPGAFPFNGHDGTVHGHVFIGPAGIDIGNYLMTAAAREVQGDVEGVGPSAGMVGVSRINWQALLQKIQWLLQTFGPEAVPLIKELVLVLPLTPAQKAIIEALLAAIGG